MDIRWFSQPLRGFLCILTSFLILNIFLVSANADLIDEAIPLETNQPQTLSTDQFLSEKLYYIDIDENDSNLYISAQGGTGDVALYVRRNEVPTTDFSNGLFDCRSLNTFNNENCSLINPQPGRWYILIKGGRYSNLQLEANIYSTEFVDSIATPLQANQVISEPNRFSIDWYTIDVPPGTPSLDVTALYGDNISAPDLFLRHGSIPIFGSNDDCSATGTFRDHHCQIENPVAGRWYLMVRGRYAYSDVMLSTNVSPDESLEAIPLGVNQPHIIFNDDNPDTFSTRLYSIDIDENQSLLNIEAQRGTGDVSLYVRHNAIPTTGFLDGLSDCRSLNTGNNESCNINNPRAGRWYILLTSGNPYHNLNLEANVYNTAHVDTLASPIQASQTLSQTDRFGIEWYTIDVPEGIPSLEVTALYGDNISAPDLYLRHASIPNTSSYDCRAIGTFRDHHCQIENPAVGRWYLMALNRYAYSDVVLSSNIDTENNKPVITLNGIALITIEQGSSYNDAGATAIDTEDGSVAVTVSGEVDTTKPGTYTLIYNAVDSQGSSAQTVTRTVTVTALPDTEPPVITLIGQASITIDQDSTYEDDGATAIDNRDESVTVATSGAVDTSTPGEYTLSYDATDEAGNAAQTVTRIVTVTAGVEINVLSPSNVTAIPYNLITLQISANDEIAGVKARNLSLETPFDQEGIQNGESYLIYNVLLQAGTNEIEISTSDGANKTTLILTSEALGYPPVLLELEDNKAISTLNTTATVKYEHGIEASEYWIDRDGDQVIDMQTTSPTVNLNYPVSGFYQPGAILKTSDNLLYATVQGAGEAVNVLENPLNRSTQVPNVQEAISDFEVYQGYVYALTPTALLKVSQRNPESVETLFINGLAQPSGLSFDDEGNAYIADRSLNKVVKLLAENNYQQADSRFVLESSGVGNGELLSPQDVTWRRTGRGTEIAVLDAGNNRIQVFDERGRYQYQFNGSGTEQGQLNNPLNMELSGSSGYLIADGGNGMLREIEYQRSSGEEKGERLIAISNMGKVGIGSNSYIIPDNNAKQLLFIQDTSVIFRLPMNSDTQIALAYDQNQQVLYHPLGASEVKHLRIPKTAEEASPTRLMQSFVSAYLNDNEAELADLVPPDLLSELKESDQVVRPIFNQLKDPEETIYFYGLKANVSAVSRNAQDELIDVRFEFNWVNEQWLLMGVM